MNKQVLREMFLEKRKTLSSNEHALRSDKVNDFAIQFIKDRPIKSIHLFMPIERQREVDTQSIFEFLQKSAAHRIILPKVKTETNELIHIEYGIETKLLKGKYGILEPSNGKLIAPKRIDCVFIPLISFDRLGHRIGYGGGYYDKFLSQLPESSLKVGLSTSTPLDLIPYIEDHDVRMDYCINHQATYFFK